MVTQYIPNQSILAKELALIVSSGHDCSAEAYLRFFREWRALVGFIYRIISITVESSLFKPTYFFTPDPGGRRWSSPDLISRK